MRAVATISVERCDPWAVSSGRSPQVAEAVRGAMREAVAMFSDGACVRPGECDAKAACAACGLLGSPGRPGRVSIAATFDAGAGVLSIDVDHGDGDAAVVKGIVRAVRRLTIAGQSWRVREVRFAEAGAEAEKENMHHRGTEDTEEDTEKKNGSERGAEAADFWVRLEALSPWMVSDFSWGTGFRAGASNVVPGSQVRGALHVEGGRVSHFRRVGDAVVRRQVRRGADGSFAEEAWEPGAIFEGRITGGRWNAISEGAIGAGRNRGYGRFRATYRPVSEAESAANTPDANARAVTIAFETDAVVASRAELGRAVFGDGAAALKSALIARGPTGVALTWVRGRPAIPAGSRFEFSIGDGDRARVVAALGMALKTGVGEGAADGYGELRVLEMYK